MAVPVNKAKLHHTIQTNYSKLQKELSSIPIERTNTFELEGHAKATLISINNLLSYLIGWGDLVLKWIAKKHKTKNSILRSILLKVKRKSLFQIEKKKYILLLRFLYAKNAEKLFPVFFADFISL